MAPGLEKKTTPGWAQQALPGLKSDLEEAKVAGVPGEDFGSQQHICLSYSTSLPDIEQGCTRIRDAFAKLFGRQPVFLNSQ